MTKVKDDFDGALHCDLMLRPSRSLTGTGKKLFYSGIAAGATLATIFAVSAGVWPVAIMVDLAAAGAVLGMAFSNRSGKEYERILINDDELRIYSHKPGMPVGAENLRASLSPYMLRVETVEDDFDVCQKLLLKSRGGVTEIGAFLPPDEKKEVAVALRNALRQVGVPYHRRDPQP